MSNLRIQRNLRPCGTVPGEGTQREEQVAKLIDITTCIGCKACEVACLEWNDLPFRETIFDNTYQTMPDMAWNYWNLIRFNEHAARRRHVAVADAQRSVHALRRPGLPAPPAPPTAPSCNTRTASSISSRITASAASIASPAARSTFRNSTRRPRRSSSARCVRIGWAQGLEPACIKACPTGCLHFGTKDDMKALAETRARSNCASIHSHKTRASTIRRAWAARSVMYVLHDITNPGSIRRAAGQSAMCRGRCGSGRGR